MTFDDIYNQILQDPEFGSIKSRKEHMKRVWNAALDECVKQYQKVEEAELAYPYEYEGGFIDDIEKLKVKA